MTRLTEAKLVRVLIMAVVVVAAISIAALGVGLLAQARSARVAHDQAEQADRQAQQLRDSICGTFLAVSSSPVSDRTSDLGRTIIIETGNGARVAGCPGAPPAP